jgi:AcrR family transcriptional regulator
MGRPRKTETSEDSATRILDAAELAFGATGYARARLEDIAAEAGMRRPSLLHHFHSKSVLYQATLKRALRDLAETVGEAMDPSRPHLLPQLESITEAMLAFAAALPVLRGELVPLVDALEAAARAAMGPALPATYPVRDGILTLFTGHLVRLATSGSSLRLWSGDDSTLTLMRALLSGSSAPAPATRT